MADNSLKVTITGPDGQKYQSQIAARLGKMPAAAWPILWKHVVRYWGEVVERRQFISEARFSAMVSVGSRLTTSIAPAR